MPVSTTVYAFATGTQSASIGTEHSLCAVNIAGEFALHVDRNAMAAGDVLELRVNEVVLTSGTKRLRDFWQFRGVAESQDIVAESPWVANDLTDSTSLEFTLKQTFGTGRSFPWKVVNRAGSVTLTNVQGIAKNTASRYLPFVMRDTSGALAAGKTVTVTRSLDGGGSWSATTGSVVEIGNGGYWFNPSAADLNGNSVALKAAATGCVDTIFGVFPAQA